MYLERLRITSFRHLTDVDLTFDQPRTLFIGANGDGKSSIIDALEWCLRGRCRGIDGRGQGAKLQIGHGATAMEVTAVIRGVGVITRSLSATGSSACSMKQEAIYARLGTTDALLTAALHGEMFFALEHAEAKALLMRMLDIRIPPEQLPALGPLPGPLDLDELDARYKADYEERAATKKALAALAPVKAAEAAPSDEELREAQEALRLARRTAQATAQALGAAQADVEAANRDVARTTRTIEQGRARLAQVDAWQTERDALQDVIAALDATPVRDDLEQLRSGGQVKLAEIARTRTALDQHEGTGACVLDAAVPCGTPSEAFAARRQALDAEHADLQRRLEVVERHVREQAARTAERRQRQTRFDGLTADLAAADAAQTALDELEAALQDATRAVAAEQRALDEAREADETAQAALDTAQQTASRLEAAHQAATTGAAARAKRAKLETHLASLEARVKALGPKGVRLAAITAGADRFERAMNAALAPFCLRLVLQVEPWQILVEDDGAPAVPFAQLSRGQGVRVSTALALAVAAMTGLDFCAIDDVDSVDPDGVRALTGLVMGASVGQVLIGKMQGAQQPAPELNGLDVVRMRRGAPEMSARRIA